MEGRRKGQEKLLAPHPDVLHLAVLPSRNREDGEWSSADFCLLTSLLAERRNSPSSLKPRQKETRQQGRRRRRRRRRL